VTWNWTLISNWILILVLVPMMIWAGWDFYRGPKYTIKETVLPFIIVGIAIQLLFPIILRRRMAWKFRFWIIAVNVAAAIVAYLLPRL
jgi:hypothetical protein